MEWIVVNPQIHTMFSSLGSYVGDRYVISQDCLMTLDEIWRRLLLEDRTLRTFRRAIGISQVLKKDLLPLLIHSKDDKLITGLTIKILANLTMPVECLLPMDVMSKTDAGRNTMYELNLFLSSCKEAFLEPRFTKRILEHIKNILEKGSKIEPTECEVIYDSLILLRNILQIPEQKLGSQASTNQNQILWNLFAQNIDKLLIDLIMIDDESQWGLSIIQLIALMYKDQHVNTLQKLLNLWFEVSLSDSSEDNESNTSPPDRDSGDSSSSMATSDPMSDSSDNNTSSAWKMETDATHNKAVPKVQVKKANSTQRSKPTKQMKKIDPTPSHTPPPSEHKSSPSTSSEFKQHKMECGSSEVSDCGYGTQLENQESISTSSNEDETPSRGMKPVHLKPANMIQKIRTNSKPQTLQEKQELKRKKLIRRSQLNSVKALLHHIPSDEDISHLLKEFTVDFLLKGFSNLVTQLHRQLLYNSQTRSYMDLSHFFWLVSFFLKLAAQLEIELKLISPVLSVDVIFYLTYEGVNLSEQFELAKSQSDLDLASCNRRMHLVVTAIRELIQGIDCYKKIIHLNEEDRNYLNILQRQVCETEDLRSLFVLLLRQFSPTLQSKQYLQDVIVTNHMLLTLLENSSLPGASLTLYQHMKQFVSVDMMCQYGLLLECFNENGQFVNDCIFTMMHHVAGDLDHINALFQPPILKTFSLIWESEFEICDDWSDLIEFVIHKFINMPRPVPTFTEKQVNNYDLPLTPQQGKINSSLSWSEEEIHNLYWYFVQSSSSKDPVGAIIQLYKENGVGNKSRIEVIEKLLQQDIITRPQYQELMEKEPIVVVKEERGLVEDRNGVNQSFDEIETLKDVLLKSNKMEFLEWIQKVLLEVCHAKVSFKKKSKRLIEPVPYYCTLLREPIPLVAWNSDQCSILSFQPFVLLLHKLGLHLPADAGKAFPRIPNFWTPETLFTVANKLGPLHPGWMKFDHEEIEGLKGNPSPDSQTLNHPDHSFSSHSQQAMSYISYTPQPNIGPNWMEMARHSKAFYKT